MDLTDDSIEDYSLLSKTLPEPIEPSVGTVANRRAVTTVMTVTAERNENTAALPARATSARQRKRPNDKVQRCNLSDRKRSRR